jgi:hypothetical protein
MSAAELPAGEAQRRVGRGLLDVSTIPYVPPTLCATRVLLAEGLKTLADYFMPMSILLSQQRLLFPAFAVFS